MHVQAPVDLLLFLTMSNMTMPFGSRLVTPGLSWPD